ncbi:MAG TPA: cystathionine gamma-synthase family protein [Acidobacteriota bacterium]|nr:cystathionine gamma-synthase family protein [Acidobacteriota bacterium]
MNQEEKKPGLGTQAVWGGEDELGWQGATQVPLVHSVTFGFDDVDTWLEVSLGRAPGHVYSRNTNPTVQVFEEKMRLLEGGEAAISFSSGMAAVCTTFFALLRPGRRVVSIRDTYGGTSLLFLQYLPRYGVEVELCQTDDHEAIEAAVAEGCDLLYLESPTNPTLKVLDLDRLIKAGKRAGAVTVVDNTFATPVNQRPLEMGADLVLHSATKFLGGHSDTLAGVLCGRGDLVKKIFQFREVNGASLAPAVAHQLIRSIKTLEVRVQRHNENALGLARFLRGHSRVEQVYYPGLEDDPGHSIARKQMSGFGGVVSFSLPGGYEEVKRFLERLRYAHRAASLGSVSTLIGPPAATSHVELTPEQRAQLGIPETLIRCSVGIENLKDLQSDFAQALE